MQHHGLKATQPTLCLLLVVFFFRSVLFFFLIMSLATMCGCAYMRFYCMCGWACFAWWLVSLLKMCSTENVIYFAFRLRFFPVLLFLITVHFFNACTWLHMCVTVCVPGRFVFRLKTHYLLCSSFYFFSLPSSFFSSL